MLIAQNLHKTYRRGPNAVQVLNGLDLTVDSGEFLSVVGASGSGKSTMMHLLGTLDSPDEGTVTFEGRRIDILPAAERERLRNQTFGFIFQFYHLLPELSTIEYVLMPMMVGRSVWTWMREKKIWWKRAEELLDRVGLSHRRKHKPRELSGGEMQRAAVARALIANPRVLFADEPTGNLDAEAGLRVVELLRDLNRSEGVTIIMVTHNLDIVGITDRVVRMTAGRVEVGQSYSVPLRAFVPLPAVI